MNNFKVGELYQLKLPDEFKPGFIWLWDCTNKWACHFPVECAPLTLLYLGLDQDLHPSFLMGDVPNSLYPYNFPLTVVVGAHHLPFVKPMYPTPTSMFQKFSQNFLETWHTLCAKASSWILWMRSVFSEISKFCEWGYSPSFLCSKGEAHSVGGRPGGYPGVYCIAPLLILHD